MYCCFIHNECHDVPGTETTAVVITITGAPEGTFTATGGLEASGTNFMVTEARGKSRAGAIHCTNMLETSEGTFILLMNCQFSTNTGTWRIVGVTGTYTNLRGNGSLVMNTQGGVFVETLTGRIFQEAWQLNCNGYMMVTFS